MVASPTGRSGAVIRVPSDQPTVQRGLNAAQPGDTVLVAPGSYRERILWPGRDSIKLVSEQGPELTILRPAADSGRVILMVSANITNATLIKGFTITGGRLVSTLTAPGNGAGISIVNAGPEISHNRIVSNRVDVPGGIGAVGIARGAGIHIYTRNAPVLHHNLIADNRIVHDRTQAGQAYGAGIYCSGPGIFYQNVFEGNESYTVGIFPVPAVTARGGGLCVDGGPALVYSNLFHNNRAGGYDTPGAHAYGGGLFINAPDAYIANNTFVGNVAQQAISWGGAICVWDSLTPVIKNNIITGNVARSVSFVDAGGGIAFRGDTTLGIPTYDYNNVYDNYPDDYYASLPGPNSLSVNPLFASGPAGNFYLSAVRAGQREDSPCIDAGDTLLMRTPVYLDSLRRTWTTSTDFAPDVFAPDMGYLYPIERPMGLAEEVLPVGFNAGLSVRPNPVSGDFATLRIEGLGHNTKSQEDLGYVPRLPVSVFDATGRNVLSRNLAASQTGSVSLDLGGLAGGVYFVRIDLADRSVSVKFLIADR